MSHSFLIKYTQHFSAIRILNKEMFPVWLTITGDLIGRSAIDSAEFRLSIAKFDFWFSNFVNNSIMFSSDNKWALEFMMEQSENMPLITPYEPTDDVLATLFTCKCNALAANALDVEYVSIEDERSCLTYTFADDTMPDLPTMDHWIGNRTFFTTPWWHRNDSSTFDILPADDDDLESPPECFFSLDFLKERFQGPAEIIRPTFKPEIILGKKK